MRVTVEDLSSSSGKDNVYKPAYQETIDANAVKVNSTPNKLVIAPASATASQAAVATVATATTATTVVALKSTSAPAATSAAMLAETETFYNQQIKKAVSSGDIEKAMTLTSEAERAGSKSAKRKPWLMRLSHHKSEL